MVKMKKKPNDLHVYHGMKDKNESGETNKRQFGTFFFVRYKICVVWYFVAFMEWERQKAKIAVPDGHCTLTCWNWWKNNNLS